jgi:hypothetical protein
MRAEIEAAYKILIATAAPKAATGTTTGSGTHAQGKATEPGKGTGAWWAIGAVLVCALLYYHPWETAPQSSQSNWQPQATNAVAQTPEPPDFSQGFIHQDARAKATGWTSTQERISNGNFTVVRGMDSKGRLVDELMLYQDMGHWRAFRQYVVNYSDDGLQVAVQRFQEKGTGAIEYADQRNVGPAGDVLVETTFYVYQPDGKLDKAVVDTPFIKGKDGVQIHRESGQVYATREPGGGLVQLGPPGREWLNDTFDLWDMFGQSS